MKTIKSYKEAAGSWTADSPCAFEVTFTDNTIDTIKVSDGHIFMHPLQFIMNLGYVLSTELIHELNLYQSRPSDKKNPLLPLEGTKKEIESDLVDEMRKILGSCLTPMALQEPSIMTIDDLHLNIHLYERLGVAFSAVGALRGYDSKPRGYVLIPDSPTPTATPINWEFENRQLKLRIGLLERKMKEGMNIQDFCVPIYSWEEVPIGARVFEDTFNQVYTFFEREGALWLKQTGWQCGDKPIPENNEKVIDFEPHALYNQPWYQFV